MQRLTTTPRNNWQKAVEALGFNFHTTDVPYWDETAYYTFTLPEVEKLESVSAELWEMCVAAVQHVIDHNLFDVFKISAFIIPHIIDSWNNDAPAIYGRFDLWYDGIAEPKLIEFNADTPTSLFEASIIQWFWLKDFDEPQDQFNSIHEKLIDYWQNLKHHLYDDTLYFTCVKNNLEDFTTTAYLQDCAMQAGLNTSFIYIEDIGWDNANSYFVDLDNQPIRNIFKLYPYEWMVNEDFGKNIIADTQQALWIEPTWKMLMSNKAILPLLWQLFPYHKNLLPAYFTRSNLVDYVKKPLLSREGANITIVQNEQVIAHSEGDYGEEGYIFQQLCKLPDFDGNYPIIGSWIVGQQPAGIGIRESDGLITNNTSRFVPHLILQ
ncbi:glutathionylspermidine synthase family protein [Mucilaginibacter paludis]|uniref:Glutathionylspermidine synthase n=1 Tax=Mucilaginibacter paludis DSM 18603 TaxID=714943 RepID=H1YH90_9SPHI|nr:glutathionylspermidine synthase family protein [Mucilaginibacter paludis]EHQ24592.1 glutathionylspermidine synthase [Mucilaginibacter paludis DSM 18603]